MLQVQKPTRPAWLDVDLIWTS